MKRIVLLHCQSNKSFQQSIFPFLPSIGEGIQGEALGMLPDPEAIANLGLPVVTPAEESLLPGCHPPLEGESRGSIGMVSPCRPPCDEKAYFAHQPFLLSAGLALIPPRLAAKIQQLEFFDMAELLRDNLEVQRRATSQGQQQPATTPSRNRRREIPDLLSWVSCFGVYAAVLTSKHPTMT